MIIRDSHYRVCVYCQRRLVWAWHGERLKDRARIYLDAEGRRWAGKRCADCEKKRVQTAIRFNRFDRMLISKELEAQGYKVKKFDNPLVVEMQGTTRQIAIRKAHTDGKAIIVEDSLPADGSCLLLFSASRLLTKEQLQQLSTTNGVEVF